VRRQTLLALALVIAVTGCGASTNGPRRTPSPIGGVLGAIVLSETEPPARTTFFRTHEGAASATQLVQDGGPQVHVSVQRGLVDGLTREFGTPGVIAMLVGGAPTESLDPARDVWVASAALAYTNGSAARTALEVFAQESAVRLETRRSVALGDGGTVFHGRFLRGMPVATYLWRNERFVLQLTAVGTLADSEVKGIARVMDERVPSVPGR
jgi:hypothetical protein